MTYRESAEALPPDRSILVVGLNGEVLGLDRYTGQVRWETKRGTRGEVFLAIGFGVVVAASVTGNLWCLDYLTGVQRWEVTTTSTGRAAIVIESDQIVCARGGYLDCFAPDGSRFWSQPLTGRGLGSAAIGYPGNIAQADDVGSQ